MNNVTEKRKELGLTVEEFANILNTTAKTVTMWEEQGNTPPIILNLVLPKLEAND
jgi:DNA-binding transcriptional regulator YiaG